MSFVRFWLPGDSLRILVKTARVADQATSHTPGQTCALAMRPERAVFAAAFTAETDISEPVQCEYVVSPIKK